MEPESTSGGQSSAGESYHQQQQQRPGKLQHVVSGGGRSSGGEYGTAGNSSGKRSKVSVVHQNVFVGTYINIVARSVTVFVLFVILSF